MKFSDKYTIKVPKNISIVYSKDKNVVILTGPLQRKTFMLKTRIFFDIPKNKIYVSKLLHFETFTVPIKHLKSSQGTTIALLKQSVLETSVKIYKKLRLIGVGYRIFLFNLLSYEVLRLKLGHSHEIYLRLNKKINFSCVKTTTFYIYGNFYQAITETCAKLRSYKIPEFYKGKGILYENELIVLKKGKKM